ncbi:hypothetical protein BSLG_007377 [Batrachochytrium salamandrivorans]|nr:hypothetical protein BSLG_007377 [Batrachochytrium salamandrivorans]
MSTRSRPRRRSSHPLRLPDTTPLSLRSYRESNQLLRSWTVLSLQRPHSQQSPRWSPPLYHNNRQARWDAAPLITIPSPAAADSGLDGAVNDESAYTRLFKRPRLPRRATLGAVLLSSDKELLLDLPLVGPKNHSPLPEEASDLFPSKSSDLRVSPLSDSSLPASVCAVSHSLVSCSESLHEQIPLSPKLSVRALDPAVSSDRSRLSKRKYVDEKIQLKSEIDDHGSTIKCIEDGIQSTPPNKKAQIDSSGVENDVTIPPAKIGEDFTVTLPTEKTPKKTPAYLRYKHLLNSGGSTGVEDQIKKSSLLQRELPSSLELLHTVFQSLEKVYHFTTSRDQRCVYHKIRKAVENLSNRSFELSHLAQIMYIYPNAYKLQAIRTIHDGATVSSVLIEVPQGFTNNISDHSTLESLATPPSSRRQFTGNGGSRDADEKIATPICQPQSGVKNSVVRCGIYSPAPVRSIDDLTTYQQLVSSATMMESRLLTFRRRLESWVEITHNAFLEEDLDRKRDIEALGGLPQWHPQFQLCTVPDLPLAVLPEPEESHFQKLWKTRGGYDMPGISASPTAALFQGINDKLNARLSRKSDVGTTNTVLSDTPPVVEASESNQADSSTPSQPASLLEADTANPPKPISRAAAIILRLREKNRIKAEQQKACPRPSLESMRRDEMMKRLPSIAQSLSMHYSSSKKTAMPLSSAMSYLTDGFAHHNLSSNDIYDHVTLLASVAPMLCQIITSEGRPVLKLLTLSKPMEIVRDAIQKAANGCGK